MNFILKIVEGPNKGAEIALPEGVAVTLGKGDDCDVVLSDATLPGTPLALKATSDGVTADGDRLEPFAVVERGASAFAIGPADAPWGELKWPKRETGNGERGTGNGERVTGNGEEGVASAPEKPKVSDGPENAGKTKKRHGCLGCLFVVLILLVALFALCWIFREEVRPYAEKARPCAERMAGRITRTCGEFRSSGAAVETSVEAQHSAESLSSFVARHPSIVLTNRTERAVLVGDFATRAERLLATAEAYAVQPGIELDFSDSESLATAVADTISLVGENELEVVAITNRVAVLSGHVKNAKRTFEAISDDVPKIRSLDVLGVSLASSGIRHDSDSGDSRASVGAVASSVTRKSSASAAKATVLPVCGILTTPYPCLVLKNGARVMEGGLFGGSVVLKIEADSVTLTNSTGRFTWKP